MFRSFRNEKWHWSQKIGFFTCTEKFSREKWKSSLLKIDFSVQLKIGKFNCLFDLVSDNGWARWSRHEYYKSCRLWIILCTRLWNLSRKRHHVPLLTLSLPSNFKVVASQLVNYRLPGPAAFWLVTHKTRLLETLDRPHIKRVPPYKVCGQFSKLAKLPQWFAVAEETDKLKTCFLNPVVQNVQMFFMKRLNYKNKAPNHAKHRETFIRNIMKT